MGRGDDGEPLANAPVATTPAVAAQATKIPTVRVLPNTQRA
jgi:hypothetical protein